MPDKSRDEEPVDDTFLWHDYETFGSNPRADRPAQFAALRTDLQLDPIEEPCVWFCRPAADYLPEPEACLVTGIGPDDAESKGLAEAQFAGHVFEQMARPRTCSVGYNSMRFDDEVTRFLLFRNFFDPYAREWRDGNSRWDLIDVVRACYAFRPQGIEWPEHDDGRPSFKLADLATANRLPQTRAHDALSDVETTLAMAKLIRRHQPRLFDYFLTLRRKQTVEDMLDVATMQPLLHVSSRFPAERGCVAMVAPICRHPRNPNGIIAYDLATDPASLIASDVDAIRDLVFTPRRDLPEEYERIPLKVIHVNRAPVLAPLGILGTVDLDRIRLDPDACLTHLQSLRGAGGIRDKVAGVFDRPYEGAVPVAEEALYHGEFLSRKDQELAAAVRSTPPERLAEFADRFGDPRLRDLLFSYRARNFPDSLEPGEGEKWRAWCRDRVSRPDESGIPDHIRKLTRLRELRTTRELGVSDSQMLDRLERYLNRRCAELGLSTVAEPAGDVAS